MERIFENIVKYEVEAKHQIDAVFSFSQNYIF